MLILRRKRDETVRVRAGGQTVYVHYLGTDRHGVARLGFESSDPDAVEIVRLELTERLTDPANGNLGRAFS